MWPVAVATTALLGGSPHNRGGHKTPTTPRPGRVVPFGGAARVAGDPLAPIEDRHRGCRQKDVDPLLRPTLAEQMPPAHQATAKRMPGPAARRGCRCRFRPKSGAGQGRHRRLAAHLQRRMPAPEPRPSHAAANLRARPVDMSTIGVASRLRFPRLSSALGKQGKARRRPHTHRHHRRQSI
jgi:hypothetical protein